MTAQEIQSKVFDIVRAILADRGRSLSLTDRLIRDLRMQSDDFSFLLVPRIEKTFGIRVPVKEWGQVSTLGDVVDLVDRYTTDVEGL